MTSRSAPSRHVRAIPIAATTWDNELGIMKVKYLKAFISYRIDLRAVATALKQYLDAAGVDQDPKSLSRDFDTPVGLRVSGVDGTLLLITKNCSHRTLERHAMQTLLFKYVGI